MPLLEKARKILYDKLAGGLFFCQRTKAIALLGLRGRNTVMTFTAILAALLGTTRGFYFLFKCFLVAGSLHVRLRRMRRMREPSD